MSGQRSGGGVRKHGRDAKKCQKYRMEGRREKNKKRRIEKEEKRQRRLKVRKERKRREYELRKESEDMEEK